VLESWSGTHSNHTFLQHLSMQAFYLMQSATPPACCGVGGTCRNLREREGSFTPLCHGPPSTTPKPHNPLFNRLCNRAFYLKDHAPRSRHWNPSTIIHALCNSQLNPIDPHTMHMIASSSRAAVSSVAWRAAAPRSLCAAPRAASFRLRPTTALAAAARSPAAAAAAAAAAAPRASLISRQRRVRVAAGWGDPVAFTPAEVVGSSKAANQLFKVQIDVGADVAAGYTKGGQYVQVKVGDSKPGFFAIASPPDPNNQGGLRLWLRAGGWVRGCRMQ